MLLTVEKIIKETEDSVSVLFKNKGFFKKINYKPGQFLTLKLPIGDQIVNRAYSLSSSPYIHNFLRITVKKVNDGLVSNYICNELKEGQKIEIDKPMGNFYVVPEKKKSHQYVFFAAGSGITPIYSIIMSILEKEPKSKMLLFYANRDKKSIIFHNELPKLEARFSDRLQIVHLLEKVGASENNYYEGRLSESLVGRMLHKYNIDFSRGKYYLCGPSGFMDKAKEILSANDVADQDIKVEAFNANLKTFASDGAIMSNVKIVHEGDTHELEMKSTKTILQAAQSQNIKLPYSCRTGMCSTCKASCTSGKVKMMEGHLLSDEEVASGKILTCISFPETEDVEIVFD